MSRTLFEVSFYFYLIAFGIYVAALLSPEKILKALGPTALGAGLVLQATALILRWRDAGRAELAAAREALGHSPHGWTRLLAVAGHPPYANLYESLTCLSFLVLLVYLVSERLWRLPALGFVSVGFGLLLLGRALLVPSPEVALLDPVLRSTWIFLHVSTVLVAFACFAVACGFGLALLLKVETPPSEIGAFLAALAAPVVFLAGGASSLIGRLAFQVSPVGLNAQGLPAPLRFVPTGLTRTQRVLVDVPWAGPFLLGGALLYAVGAFFYLRSVGQAEGEPGSRHPGFWTTLAATSLLGIALAILFGTFWLGGSIATPTVAGQIDRGLAEPYRLSIAGNPDAVGLLLSVLVASVAFLAFTASRSRLRATVAAALPDASRLDAASRRLITLGFPLLTLGIVIGAVWAQTSWGTYWSWEPKETWALITWIVYALYLHARLRLGWTGKPAAALAVAGFAVVVFCYLGVNLGLTGDGLHSFGSG